MLCNNTFIHYKIGFYGKMVDNRTSIDVRGMHGPSPPDYTIIPIGSVERLFSIAVAITRTMSGNLTLQIPTKFHMI